VTRSTRERLPDMIEQIERVRHHIRQSDDLDDEIKAAATIRWLEVLGEAAASVPQDFRASHVDIPWRQIVGMRNILIHAYPDVLPHRVWAAVEQLSDLQHKLEVILKESQE
jgi:uncharacterized protein with HEPN domain